MRPLLFPPPFQMIIAGAIMWALDRQLPELAFSFPGQRKVATVLIAVGIIIEVIAMASFVLAKTTVNPIQPEKTTHLVTGGLFRFSRNPMYAGMLLLLTGWMIRLGCWVNIPILFAFVAIITTFQIKPEEHVLREKFGQDYIDYCAKVRRWL